LKAGRSVRILIWPDGNLPTSLLIEHREIASAASLHVALSGLLSKHSYSFIQGKRVPATLEGGLAVRLMELNGSL
jgi:hypothetical protein